MNNIINWTLDQIISDRFASYSKYIIQERALPDARDGLKTVQRRILYAMYDLHLFHNKPFKKSARIVGEVIGKYHPHGDTSIYDALVRISQYWKMNIPLVNMHGNNGSIDDDPAAAMRYTEVRLTEIAQTMMENIDSDCVRFIPNFDDSEKEPIVLPALLPNLLINGARGIAAGFATEMPPHNLNEIINAIKIRIKSPNCRLDTILNEVKGPDFPTGGTIIGKEGIYQAFERGNGRIIIQSKYNINYSDINPSISISEIPYGVIKSKLVKEIDLIRFHNKIYGIKEVRDESDRNGLKIYIKLFKDSNPKMILLYLFKKTQLQVYYSYNNIAISQSKPKKMSLLNLIDEYINHQKNVILSYSKFNLRKKERKLEIINGLIKVSNNIDAVIQLIKNCTGTKNDVIIALNKFGFTIIQSNAIADLKLYRLSKTDKDLYLKDKVILNSEIKTLGQMIDNENILNTHLIKKLKIFSNKYSQSRKTQIIDEASSLEEIDDQELIKKGHIYIGISKLGYMKSISIKSYELNALDEYKLKEKDMLIFFKKVNTLDVLLIFTNRGRAIKIPAHLIGNTKFSAIGSHLNDVAILHENEIMIKCFNINNFDNNLNIILASKYAKIKRTPLIDYKKASFSRFFTIFSLNFNDQLISCSFSNNLKNLVIITNTNHAVKYPETIIPLTGCKSSGVKSIKLKDNFVIGMIAGHNNEIIGLISNRGGLKKIIINDIYPYTRISYGKEIVMQLKSNPHVIINLDIISSSSIFLININNKIIQGDFNKIINTKATNGFNKIYSDIDSSLILTNDNDNIIDENENLEKRFKDAEDKVNKISQLSIDEIMKKAIS